MVLTTSAASRLSTSRLAAFRDRFPYPLTLRILRARSSLVCASAFEPTINPISGSPEMGWSCSEDIASRRVNLTTHWTCVESFLWNKELLLQLSFESPHDYVDPGVGAVDVIVF